MLSSKFKIRSSFRIEYINKKGKRIRGELMQLRYLPSRNKYNCYACVVSKQISKKAVERNTIRRRIHEALRDYLTNRAALPSSSKTCYDVVVLGSMRTLKAPFRDIVNELSYFLEYLS